MPTSQEFLDIVLSRTQRQLPTVIRAGFKISRIRGIVTIPRLKGLFACDGRHGRWLLGMIADKKNLFSPDRVLYSEGQIYPGNFLRKVPGDSRGIPQIAGHSSFP